MTAYVSDHPWINATGAKVFNLWADTSNEAVAALYAIGGDVSQRRVECNSWEAYAITPDQFVNAAALGIKVTDRWGPVEWLAHRDGRQLLLARIADARARGCA